MDKDPFKEYMKQSEPNKRDKGYAWHTAIGLQAVDGLKTSKYLIDTAIKNIEGDISIDEAQELLNTYYEENPKADIEDRTEEADKVAVRIAKILSEKAFSFTPNEYISIHKKLFTGIYGHAGLFEFILERALSAVISATTCTDVDSVVEAGTCNSYPFLYCESLE